MRTTTSPSTRLASILCAIAALAWAATTVQAQDAARLIADARAAYEDNNYQKSSELYTAFIEKFPQHIDALIARYYGGVSYFMIGRYDKTEQLLNQCLQSKEMSERVRPSALFYLGNARFYQQKYDEAIDAFTQAQEQIKSAFQNMTPDKSKDLKEFSPLVTFYLAQCKMGKANAAAEKNIPAEPLFREAIQAFEAFVKEYPGHALELDALIDRARIYAIIRQYEQAEAQLDQLRKRPEASDLANDLDYLLGFVLSQSAQNIFANNDKTLDEKKKEAAPIIDRARDVYARLIDNDDFVVANEASFQLANLELASGNYKAALKAYRSVRSKEQLLASQDARIKKFVVQVSESAQNSGRLDLLNRLIQREKRKRDNVAAQQEIQSQARVRMGDCLTLVERFDEARVLLRHLATFQLEPEIAKEVDAKIIVTMALQGMADKSTQAYENFKNANPKDPMALTIKVLIGQALMKRGRFEDAIKEFETCMRDFTDSLLLDQIPALMAACYKELKQFDKAIKVYDDFIQKAEKKQIKATPEVIDSIKREKAATLFEGGKTEEAILAMRDLLKSTRDDGVKEVAEFQIADMLAKTGKSKEAVAGFEKFLKSYPNSQERAAAYVKIVEMLEKQDQAAALKTIEQMEQEFKTNEKIHIYSLEKNCQLLQSMAQYEKMFAVQDRLIAQYPQSDRSLLMMASKAKFFKDQEKNREKAIASYLEADRFFKNLPKDVQANPSADYIAACALYYAAELSHEIARSLGSTYKDLDEKNKSEWDRYMAQAEQLLNRCIQEHGQSAATPLVLKKLVEVLTTRVNAGLIDTNQVIGYFTQMAGKYQNESLIARILSARAAFAYKCEIKRQAFEYYKDLFGRASHLKTLEWEDYGNYGNALLSQAAWDKAIEIATQLRQQFPKPAHAQAEALYILAAATKNKGDSARAQKLFDQLKTEYPWSPHIHETDLEQADTHVINGEYDMAIDIFNRVMLAGTVEKRAQAMIEKGKTLLILVEKKLPMPPSIKNSKREKDLIPEQNAINHFIMVDAYYPNLPDLAAEGLYRAAAVEIKRGNRDAAQKFATELTSKYPSSRWVNEARKLFD